MDTVVAGTIAALTVDILIYPLDTLKSRIQDPQRNVHFPDGKGMSRGLYQGIGPVLLVSLPAAGAFFTTYESVKRVLAHPSSPLSPHSNSGLHAALGPAPMHLVASSVGELVSCAILTPAEILKQRAQVVNKELEGSGKGSHGSSSSSSSTPSKPKSGLSISHLKQLEVNPTPPSTSRHPSHAKWSPYAPGDPSEGPSHRVKHPESGATSAPHSQALKPTPPRSAASSMVRAAASYATDSASSLRGSYLRGFFSLAGRNLPFTAIQFPLYESFRARIGQSVGLKAYTSPEDGSVVLKKESDSVLGDGSLGRAVGRVKERLTGDATVPGLPTSSQRLTVSDLGKTFLVAGGSAAGAGAIAALLTTPIDVAKTNIMLDKSGRAEGVIRTVRTIFVKEGAAGLMRGGVLRVFWTAAGAGLYLGSYESGRQWWNNRA